MEKCPVIKIRQYERIYETVTPKTQTRKRRGKEMNKFLIIANYAWITILGYKGTICLEYFCLCTAVLLIAWVLQTKSEDK